jgi:membrane fusion protein (multidrug efflux system)
MKRTYYLLIVISIAAACSKDKPVLNQRQMGPIIADGFLVQAQRVSEKVEVPGSLIPMEETEIRSEVSGRVVALNILEGSVISKGSLLVKLFDGDLQNQLKKLEVQLQIAEKTEERQRELLKINGISQQDYDLTQLNVENLKIDIETVKIAISKTEIRAPYSGKIGLRYVSLGSYLSPTSIITSIRDVSQLKLEFSIPERYARSLGRGHLVTFRVDGGKVTHNAAVIATENSVDEATRTLRVRALVKATHPELVPGTFAQVNLQLGEDTQALMVPTQAIIPQARNKQVILYRNDSVRFAVVETGIRDSVYVQITHGVQAGDTVIISGLMAIRPNSTVKLTRVSTYQ